MTLSLTRFLAIPVIYLMATTCSTATAQTNPLIAADEYRMRVMIASVDGSHIGIVTHVPGYLINGSPEWSADGKKLAFDARKPDSDGTTTQIIIVSLDGAEPVVLGDGAMPSFSPDGTQVTYSRYSPHSGVWKQRIDEAGHPPELVAKGGWCGRWSPDGRCISYTEFGSDGPNFCLQNIADGQVRRLFPSSGGNPYRQLFWNYSWSPDGKLIAGSAMTKEGQREVFTVSTDGAAHGLTRRQLWANDHRVTFTPDGHIMIAMGPGNKQQIYTVDFAEPSAAPRLFPLAPDRSVHAARISPDGQMIAFVMNHPLPDFAAK